MWEVPWASQHFNSIPSLCPLDVSRVACPHLPQAENKCLKETFATPAILSFTSPVGSLLPAVL